ncbi:MAG: hypothetical protein ACYTFY_23345 [Planctomycetota bacterium]|jgi:hypothetical protein
MKAAEVLEGVTGEEVNIEELQQKVKEAIEEVEKSEPVEAAPAQ